MRSSASAARPAVAAPAAEQLSRRSRRAQTGEQPVVVPPIAPVAPEAPARAAAAFEADLPSRDEPAPLRDTVLAPAEPFELLAPVVDAERAATPAPAAQAPAEPSEPAAAHSPSDWMAETLARLMAAEAAAAPAPAPAVVEPVAPPRSAAPAGDVRAAESIRAAEPVRAEEQVRAAGSVPAAEPVRASQRPTETVIPAPEPAAERPRTERPRTERVEPLTGPIPAPAAPGVDEFEAAARLFSFTGETPTQRPAPAAEEASDAPAAHTATRRVQTRRGSAFRRVATTSFSIGVFGVVGLIAVGMTTPVEAVAAVRGTDALSVIAPGDVGGGLDDSEIQAYVAPGDAQSDPLDRTENYAITTTAQLASEAGIRNFSNLFHNDPNSNIQWPFAVGVTMSYGFGMRSGRMHEGIDFTPGAGSPVQAIADGTVRIASESGGAYGVHVVIDHIVDGQLVSSHYAHMQYGSLKVVAGQHVTVGTVIGRTGNTGRSFGAHTHFEIWKNGTTPIDPWPWLQTYTDGTHTVG
ncbi:peptidoglycan DD-metalloendopeptidase family protein [Microbacterium jejuense]|uniref:Peptidoglycan DD-metalloendopeptidase family protein n=1 Tax=Microbacterium jejuense TaxID=1263637 RepID=A0ABS7HJE2_9MICO|nr:peptidoglycan DD-metalloendopeptidase family protein [Microbacterium jejuense]